MQATAVSDEIMEALIFMSTSEGVYGYAELRKSTKTTSNCVNFFRALIAWRHRAALPDHRPMPKWRTRLGLRSSAIVVRPAPAPRSMPSADRAAIPQSGNWKPH
jgi:hypothetical protein